MQYLPVPVTCCEGADVALLSPALGAVPLGDICALATDMPTIRAATAVKVLSVFMSFLLTCAECPRSAAGWHARTTDVRKLGSWNPRGFCKKERPGKFPAAQYLGSLV